MINNLKRTSLFLLLTLVACSEKNSRSETAKTTETIETDVLNFKEYKVSKGQIGEIKIGKRISELTTALSTFTSKEIDAYDFGFDGGGKAIVYSYKNEAVFALVPAYETDYIIALIALHKNLVFKSGIQVGMSVDQVLKHYPNAEFELNLMSDWEEIADAKNAFILVFKTDEEHRIGTYTKIGEPSKPFNLKPKMAWVTLL
jgi:hypothetical protein